MNKVELLAPAKDLETAIAAINSGADAIYIGASYFGARHNASNSLESIAQLVNYAHKFYVRVHVTINTILNNSELEKAIELVKNLYNIGVDAIIIQDMGLLKAAIDGKLPPIQIHISTQCNNRTLQKVKFFDDLGVSRVILARELSLKQIEEICRNSSCEIETFIHGALCVSYSGQCYMSYANGGRSANRGECAQPCRKRYSLVNSNGDILIQNKYLLSLKDFNASESIEKLILYGVKSFKIEGRLKDINYVRNVTLFYNNLINKFAHRTSSGIVFSDFEPNLHKTFNRSYTDYFLKNRSKCYNLVTSKSMGECCAKVTKVYKNYFEVDCAIFYPQDGLFFIRNGEIFGFLVNRVDGNKIYPNKMIDLCVDDTLYRNYDAKFDKILTNSKIVRKIGVNINILENSVVVTDEDNNSVSLPLPEGEYAKNPDKLKDSYIKQFSKVGDTDFYIINISFADKLPFLSISTLNNIRRELLSLLMAERMKNYPKIVQKPICYREFPDKNLDYRSNILNDEAQKFYENCGCIVEQRALESSKIIPSGIELMRSKHCIKYALGQCKKDLGQLYLQDDKGKKYPLEFDCSNCEMIVLNP